MDEVRSSYENYIYIKDEALVIFETDKTVLPLLASYYLKLFYQSTVLEKDEQVITGYLKGFVDASVATYIMAANINKKIVINFLDDEYRIVPPEINYMTTCSGWIDTYYAAILTRDTDAIELLECIDLQYIMEQVKGREPYYIFLYAEFLQKRLHKGVDPSALLLKASDESMELPKDDPRYDYMLDIAGPQIDLFTFILYKEEKEFNSLLKDSIGYFKNYYENLGFSETTPESFVSLPLSALAVISKESGLTITHTSDYLPSYLLNDTQ